MKKQITMILSGLFLAMGVQTASAAMVSTQSLLQVENSVVQAHDSAVDLRAMLTHDLVDLGVSATDAAHRVSLLTNEQIVALNAELENMPAGGDILGVAVLIFLVFIFTDAVGATDVFTFVKPI
ncbi:DUF6627 family protein [Thiomicrorhabdus aquaedulcis]|uniref:DUF6627 family protein n=1 Tax=Thiomicrorhabdus aquaedulcis TaxID=2211106 RepID=UPI000FDC9F84|nr:DUF6627 family protein [Thiomicrorhabdus aquaedulcis]